METESMVLLQEQFYKFATPDSPDNIVLQRMDNGLQSIKGATLHKLIERLTYHKDIDPTFARTFLTTFRSFCTPHMLLNLLIERYNIVCKQQREIDNFDSNHSCSIWTQFTMEYIKPVQLRVLNVLRHWVEYHFYDFEQDPELLLAFLNFVRGLKESYQILADSIMKIIQKKQRINRKISQITIDDCDNMPESNIHLLTIQPHEFARQLTIFQFDLYKKVDSSELLDLVWTKSEKEKTSPNLLRMIKHTTNFTNWISKSILDAENIDERATILRVVIELMMHLSNLNNFNGILSIVAALDSASIHRLKFTFAKLSPRYTKFLEDCRELIRDHAKLYLKRLRSINPPCVPFLGIFLTNILHIEQGNQNELPNTDLINFSKRQKIGQIIEEIQRYQMQPYCTTVIPDIRRFIEHINPFDGKTDSEISDYLFDESSRIEPKHLKEPLKFKRKWPNVSLKSPGIKSKKSPTLNTEFVFPSTNSLSAPSSPIFNLSNLFQFKSNSLPNSPKRFSVRNFCISTFLPSKEHSRTT